MLQWIDTWLNTKRLNRIRWLAEQTAAGRIGKREQKLLIQTKPSMVNTLDLVSEDFLKKRHQIQKKKICFRNTMHSVTCR